jgi:hypothetical protein
MSKLFLDVLGNKELVDGYQIEDSIAQKYNLKPGTICPFTHLPVETLSPEKVREIEEAERLKKIKQKKALGKDPSAADRKATTKHINHPSESHDFARRRARSVPGPVRRNLIFEKEEVRMATAKKVPAKPAKAVAKAPAKAKVPVKAPAKAVAKAPAKATAKPVAAKAKAVAKAPAKAKAKAKAPVKAKAVAKKPAKAKK